MMGKKTKWMAVFLIVAALCGGGYMYYKKDAAVPVVKETVKVERGNAKAIVSATGTIKPLDSVEISSKITARIKSIPVKENDHVTLGQTLVVLEAKELETKIDQARYSLSNARAKYERMKNLHAIGAKSDQELEDALFSYQTAESNLAGAQTNIDDTVIVSPMDGIVVGEPKTVGTLVAQGVNNPTVIMTIADLSKKQISAKVDETDIGQMRVGQKATFTVDAYTGKSFTATVANISQTDVDNSWSESSSSTATVIYYTVTLDVEDPENLLKPAMTARVEIHVMEKENVLLVPLAALKTSTKGNYVVVVQPDGTTRNAEVKVGVYSDDKVEILEGLADDDILSLSYDKAKAASSNQMRFPGGR